MNSTPATPTTMREPEKTGLATPVEVTDTYEKSECESSHVNDATHPAVVERQKIHIQRIFQGGKKNPYAEYKIFVRCGYQAKSNSCLTV